MMDDAQMVSTSTLEGGGSPAISVVVTTIPTSTSQTTCVGPGTTDTPRRHFSHIKLVGVNGLERQNYCCGHWFPSSKSYHRHLAEKAMTDSTHEAKLVELGMVRCMHCSVWVLAENISAHLKKNHSNIKDTKASKVVPASSIREMPGLSGEALPSGTNIVIKVTGQSAARSFSGDITKNSVGSLSKSGTVKLVTTSSSTLYQKLNNVKRSNTNGTDKVLVRKSITGAVPMVNVGPRIVMKSLGPGGVVPLGGSHKIVQCSSKSGPNTVTGVNGVATTTVQLARGGQSSSETVGKEMSLTQVIPHGSIQNVSEQSLKLVKRFANLKGKHVDGVPSNSQSNPELSQSTKTKEKGKVLSSGETGPRKGSQGKKSRKQVLKPSMSEVAYAETPPPQPLERKPRKRGRKPKLLNPEEGTNSNPPLNHKGYRRKFKETFDYDTYSPKMRQIPKGVRGGWKKKKRGPGRPRKVRVEETPETSEVDSLFDEVDKEDLENEPVVIAKKEEENIPTVELDLFTLPSVNEQVSVLLTEPQNPNFKVYASMDAIFVGDSALGDVTNQIGYVTDANNVVYVNPGHFLFPNVEDLENFVPSPILTMKGNKVGFTPARKAWNITSNKAYVPNVLRDTKLVSVNSSKEALSSDAGSEKINLEDRESHMSPLPAKPKVGEHILKAAQSDNTVQVNQENASVKQEIKPVALTDSTEPDVSDLLKEPQTLVGEVDTTQQKASKKVIRVRKRRRKSGMKSELETETVKDDLSISESIPPVAGEFEDNPAIKPATKPATSKVKVKKQSKDRTLAQEPKLQDCVVKLEELKYPLNLDKYPIVPPELLNTPILVKDIEETTLEEVMKATSPVRIIEKSSCEVEMPADYSLLKVDDVPVVTDNVAESPKPSVVETNEEYSLDSAVDDMIDKDSAVDDMVDKDVAIDAPSLPPPVAEVSKLGNRTLGGGGLPRRRRRRRLRTKSANIVSSITESVQEPSSGGDERRLRCASESSTIPGEAGLGEVNRVSNISLSDILGSAPLLKKEHERGSVRKRLVSPIKISLLGPMSYPLTPTNTINLGPSSSSSQEKTPGDDAEVEKSVSPLLLPSEKSRSRPSKKGKKRKNPKTLDALCVETLKTLDTSVAVVCEQESAETSEEGKTPEVRAVRERRPSFKLLESLSVASQSPKRTHGKGERQGTSPAHPPPDIVEDVPFPEEDVPVPVPSLDLSPPREWHGRGAKLKAQVLIQDQQAGVTDSHIYPPSDLLLHSPDKSSGLESFSPKISSPSVESKILPISPTRPQIIYLPGSKVSPAAPLGPKMPSPSPESKASPVPTSPRIASPSLESKASPTIPTSPEMASPSQGSKASPTVPASPKMTSPSAGSKASPTVPASPTVALPSPGSKAMPATPASPKIASPTESKASPTVFTSPKVALPTPGSKESPTTPISPKMPSLSTGFEASPTMPSDPEVALPSPGLEASPTVPVSPEITSPAPCIKVSATLSSSPNRTSPSPGLGASQTMPTTPTLTKSPATSTLGSPKTLRSPTVVQNREWQARGAKLKAQVMISDPESNLLPYTIAEESQVTSPPAKKIKLDRSPVAMKDIRSFFKVQKSPVHEEDSLTSPSSSPAQTIPVTPTSQTKRKKNNKHKNDIRAFFAPVSNQVKGDKRKEASTTQEPTRKTPKREDSMENVSAPSSNPLEHLESRPLEVFVKPLPIAQCTFNGFERCSRQSGLRSKSLLRLVSVLSMKSWYRLDKFPFPVDQLCDWNDDLLTELSCDQ